ncbi:MAG TPA: hypothetical protein VGQ71_09245 [Terriglobales bacterium]|jgi:hypothetical protein|nr:hypothetical protein [Terriglobales bacterium]
MRKSALVLVLMLALAALALAQYGSSTSQSTPNTSATPAGHKSDTAKGNTLTGCLSGPDSQGMFTLNTTGKKKKAVTIDAGTTDLKPHVGHEVRVTGTWEATPAAGATTAPSGEKKMKQFKLSNIEHISDTCPAPSAGQEAPPK